MQYASPSDKPTWCMWCANGVQDAQKNRSLHQAQARDGALGITGWVGILGMFTLSFF